MRKVVSGLIWIAISGALLPAPARAAEAWRGPSSLEVRVEDANGQPVPGAKVRLLYQAVEPKAGPGVLSTDASGEAFFFSLSEGWWVLEVRKEGALTFHAEVVLSGEKKPAVLSTFQENNPGATQTLRIKIGRPRAGAANPSPAAAQIAKALGAPSAPPPPAPPSKPAPAAGAPAAPGTAAPVAPPSQPAPAPKPAPAQATAPVVPPSPPAQKPSTDTPPAQPAPTSKPAPVQPPPPPAAPVAPPSSPPAQQLPTSNPPEQPAAPAAKPTPAPAPAPIPQPPAAPQPIPEPAAPAPQILPTQHRSYADRTCLECKAGEDALSVELAVPAGSEPCGDGLQERLENRDPAAAEAGLPPNCRLLRIVLPAGARFTGYRYEVEDRGSSRDCRAGADCPAGACSFPLDPGLRRGPQGMAITTAFSNLSPERERRAIFTVYYAAAGR